MSSDYQLHNMPPVALPHIRDVTMAVWMKTDTESDFRSSHIRNIHHPSEPYADFIDSKMLLKIK